MRKTDEIPELEVVAEAVHEDWRAKKLAANVTSRKSAETGEELMVPYSQLSEASKELNRQPVRTVYAAIQRVTNKSTPSAQPKYYEKELNCNRCGTEVGVGHGDFSLVEIVCRRCRDALEAERIAALSLP